MEKNMNRNKIIVITIAVFLLICWCFAITSRIKKLSVPGKPVPAPPPPIKKAEKVPEVEIIERGSIEETIEYIINRYQKETASKTFVKEMSNELEKHIEELTKELSSAEEQYPQDSPKAKLLEDLKKMRKTLPKN